MLSIQSIMEAFTFRAERLRMGIDVCRDDFWWFFKKPECVNHVEWTFSFKPTVQNPPSSLINDDRTRENRTEFLPVAKMR